MCVVSCRARELEGVVDIAANGPRFTGTVPVLEALSPVPVKLKIILLFIPVPQIVGTLILFGAYLC